MASSLAVQLAQNASLNSALLVDRSRRKPTASYLFTGPDADQYDLVSIHALAVNGLMQLIKLDLASQASSSGTPSATAGDGIEHEGVDEEQDDVENVYLGMLNAAATGGLPKANTRSRLEDYEDELFSDSVKGLDRTLLNKEKAKGLDVILEGFMNELGPWLLEPPCGRVLEWLVRRFRVNEFNVDAVIRLFLPYHESPHFAKMLSILHLKPNTTWSFLIPFKSAAQALPRTALVTAMLKDSDVARFVSTILPDTIKQGLRSSSSSRGSSKRKRRSLKLHHTLIAFNVATILEFVERSRKLDEGTVAFLLPAILEGTQSGKEGEGEVGVGKKKHVDVESHVSKDAILGSYVLLAALSQKCDFAPKALEVVVASMTACAKWVKTEQFLNALVVVCQPQEQLQRFSPGVVKNVVKLTEIETKLADALRWAGVEKVVCPLLGGLVHRLSEDKSSTILESLISNPNTPSIIISTATTLLISLAINSEVPATQVATARVLLSLVQQRYPVILQNAGKQLVEDGDDEDDEVKEKIEQLTISLSITHTSTASTSLSADSKVLDLIVGSSSADSTVRVVSVKGLLKLLSSSSSSELDINERDAISSALLARTQDTHPEVVELLYGAGDSALDAAIPVLIKDPHVLVSNIIQALGTTNPSVEVKPKKALVKLHLGFIVSYLLLGSAEEGKEVKADVIEKVFWGLVYPFLVYTKPRQHTAELVWDVVKELEGKLGDGGLESLGPFELIKGCVTVVEEGRGDGASDQAERMVGINEAVVKLIAGKLFALLISCGLRIDRSSENMLKSNEFHQHLDVLLRSLRDRNSHTRTFSYLIARGLVGIMSGEQQVDVVIRVLDAAGLQQFEMALGEGGTSKKDAYDKCLDDLALGKSIVSKPSSSSTSQYLQVSLLALAASIPRPQGVLLNWFSGSPSNSNPPTQDAAGPHGQKNKGVQYVQLIRSIYRVVNTGLNVPALMTSILGTMFISLKDDALTFLAGFWASNTLISGPNNQKVDLSSNESDSGRFGLGEYGELLRYVALKHGVAFLNAHLSNDASGGVSTGLDFQTIVPALIVALQSAEGRCREAAVECLKLLRQAAEKKFSAVYKFDVVYGRKESDLQYLEQGDVKKYLGGLIENRDSFVLDGQSVGLFHRQHLGYQKTDKKKESEYKHRVLCYLLSHINTIPSISSQIALLKSIEAISDPAKVVLLLPSLKALLSVDSQSEARDLVQQEYADLLVAGFDGTLVRELNGSETKGEDSVWSVYVKLMRKYFSPGAPKSVREVLSNALTNGVFAGLKFERQVEVCEILLEIGNQSIDAQTYCKALLATLVRGTPLIVHLLTSLQPHVAGTTPRVKRAKTSSEESNPIPSLTVLLESLSEEALQGSLELVSALLDTLNKVVASKSGTELDGNYVEQLLMSAIEIASDKITEVPNLRPSAIRLDILVELIRVSSNPQTFHQALLLMASLARLAPDSIHHNIMPVFTFMGSNVFYRDDSYSFRVVQKTIENIVPVMVSSLKQGETQSVDLYKKSKEFLMIFTDAANHIPRHRRNNFYTHLINVLGSQDFLAPISMLLVEKLANKVVRQTADDLQTTLSLPTAVLQHHPPNLQLHTLTEIVKETQRLAKRMVQPTSTETGFLDIREEEHSASPAVHLKRVSQALIIFVGHALRTSPNSSQPLRGAPGMGELVASLIELATLGTSLSDGKLEDITQAARLALNHALCVMSAMDFLKAIASMLQSSEQIQLGALDLLAARISGISEEARQQVTSVMIQIIDQIRGIISSRASTPRIKPAFAALASIGGSLCAGEESAVTTTIPSIVAAIKTEALTTSALAALSPLPAKLGPRLIPYFRDIVQTSVGVLRQPEHESTSIHTDAVSVLTGLLTSIPQFWGNAEFTLVLNLYVEQRSTQGKVQSATSKLVKAIAKKAAPKTLIPVVIEMWGPIKKSANSQQVTGYFDIIGRVLRAAPRDVITEMLRPLFTLFLEALGTVADMENGEAESRVIAAFRELVVKLNEAAFRPLFRRLYDWAFASEATSFPRKITFLHLYLGLLEFFKGLMTSYMSFLLRPSLEVLKHPMLTEDDHHTLWVCIVEVINKTLDFDDGAYWRDDKLREISTLLVKQLPACVETGEPASRTLLRECFTALIDNVTDDTLLKSINLNLLMHTRSEDVQTKLFALSCSIALWQGHGNKLAGFAAETATFISECTEDENDIVVQESLSLKNAVESITGSIEGL
ncbi:hypothetical protein BDN72DRAFT_432062 [Pluteus cervinus]|uniref:Uncharacterized protein n=1 Tax=Pluteus cervinus TaxID=181527 RepID=A0ACD3B0N4_9AGAR|nr:hypothetical protein BDN72DRAFT_432062 [Pluteus cervinus]